MSAEQTGRIDSLVDKTSDIYSLGITFFQLLTSKTPFSGDSSQLIYSHIAKEPPTMKSFVPEIPDCLENLVQKMIQKNQKNRYNSVIGIKKELEFIQNNLTNENVLKKLKAGQFQLNDNFIFQDKLYGREEDIEILLKNLKTVREKNSVVMSVIAGSSGIGKSV
jgi:serine/threonine protein kinase